MNYPSPMVVLEALRDLLAEVDGVETCKIGWEANSTPDDYPLIRIVPQISRPSTVSEIAGLRQHECVIYFGMAVHEFTEGLEALYTAIYEMERAIINALPRSGDYVVRWVSTETDDDNIEAFKILAMTVLIDG